MEMLGYGTINARAARRGMRRDPYAVAGSVFGFCALVGLLGVQPGAIQGHVPAASSIVTATLTVAKVLGSNAAGRADLAGSSSRPPFIGEARGVSGSAAHLWLGLEKGATAFGDSIGHGFLTVSNELTSQSAGQASGQAVIFKGDFSASAHAVALSSGSLTVEKLLQAIGAGHSTMHAIPAVEKRLWSVAAGQSTVIAGFINTLVASVDQRALIAATLRIEKSLASGADSASAGNAVMSIGKPLVADVLARTNILGQLSTGGALAAQAQGAPSVDGSVTIFKSLKGVSGEFEDIVYRLAQSGARRVRENNGARASELTINTSKVSGTLSVQNSLMSSVSGTSIVAGSMIGAGDTFYRVSEAGARRIRESSGTRVREEDTFNIRLAQSGARRLNERGQIRNRET